MSEYRLPWLNDYLAWLEQYRPDDTVRIREVKEMIKREGGAVGSSYKTKTEDSMESITVDGWTVSLLKPVTLAGIIKCGNVGCGEFKSEFKLFSDSMYGEDDCLGPDMFENIPLTEDNARNIFARPKWRDFLVQHGFIEVKKAEPEFQLGMGDCITIRGARYVLAAISENEITPIRLEDGVGKHHGGPYRVKDLDHLTVDEFKKIVDDCESWQSIYATKCRIKEVVTEKA